LTRIFTGRLGFDKVGGIIGATASIKDVVDNVQAQNPAPSRFIRIILEIAATFCVLISVSVGIFNLIPFPALDGGRIVFLLVEGIRRKPMNPEKEGMIHAVGLTLLLALMVVIIFKDALTLMFK